MEIKGQPKVLSYIDSLTIDTLPKSLMLVGEQGSGKHTICKYIANKFNIELEPLIPEKLDKDTSLIQAIKERIDEFYNITSPHMYWIDGSFFVSRGRGELNSLLKLLEEPLPAIYLGFLCETTTNVLDTILNRCYQIKLEYYSRDIMKSFLTENDWPDIVKVVHTPGQLLSFRKYQPQDVADLYTYFKENIGSMAKASYPNVLSINNKKIDYGEKVDKDDKNIRFAIQDCVLVMLYALKTLYYENKEKSVYYKVFCITDKLYNDLKIFNIDFKPLFEHYLVEIKKVITDDTTRTSKANI